MTVIVTRDAITGEAMTIRVSPQIKGIDIVTIPGKHHSLEQFDTACEIAEIRKMDELMNFVPLTWEGAKHLRDTLTKALEAE